MFIHAIKPAALGAGGPYRASSLKGAPWRVTVVGVGSYGCMPQRMELDDGPFVLLMVAALYSSGTGVELKGYID